MPEAPGLLSTSTGWPHSLATAARPRCAPPRRGRCPPNRHHDAHGTLRETGRACARAAATPAASVPASRPASKVRRGQTHQPSRQHAAQQCAGRQQRRKPQLQPEGAEQHLVEGGAARAMHEASRSCRPPAAAAAAAAAPGECDPAPSAAAARRAQQQRAYRRCEPASPKVTAKVRRPTRRSCAMSRWLLTASAAAARHRWPPRPWPDGADAAGEHPVGAHHGHQAEEHEHGELAEGRVGDRPWPAHVGQRRQQRRHADGQHRPAAVGHQRQPSATATSATPRCPGARWRTLSQPLAVARGSPVRVPLRSPPRTV
jgi:hypothetical protein